jgi:outer membrane receptor protein involved in Fe transport
VALDWVFKGLSARIAGRYIGSYHDYQDIPNNNVLGNVWLWDLSASANLPSLTGMQRLKTATLRVSVSNLFNRDPDYSNYDFGSVGYDPAQYSLLGRLIRVGVTVDF